MGFPADELTSNENVVLKIHPHWKSMVRPGGILLLVLIAVGLSVFFSLNSILLIVIGAIGLVLVVIFSLWPFMKWRSTHYVFTNERVLTRIGVFGHDMESIPLNRVNDVSYHQSFWDRLFGCGSLTIESAGDHGQDTFKEIPHVSRVMRQLHELIDPDDAARPAPAPKQASSDGSTQQMTSN